MKVKLLFATLSLVMLSLGVTVAQTQQGVYRGTNRSVRQTILRIENRTDTFRNSLQTALNRRGTTFPRSEDPFTLVSDFDQAVRLLHQRFDRRESTAADAQEVLNRASRIDDFMRRYALDAQTQGYWSSMRVDLNQLAGAYSVSWPQSTGNYPRSGNRFGGRLNGTYRLDLSRSDNARDMAERATRDLPRDQQQRVLDSITRRLDAPEQIAIEVQGRMVTIASTRAPKITFEADGVERTETGPNGRTIRARATMSGGLLTVTTTGNSGNDFTVTFEPVDNGQRLTVTRRLFAQGLSRPVVVQSSYEKTDDVARFDIYNPQNYPGQPYPGTTGGFVVPDGTTVVGILDDPLSTKTAAVGDRFTLRVTQPGEFEGATIEGHVSNVERSGRLTGRSVMTLDFDNIRLRDGRTYRFAGIVENVRAPGGESVKVDTEGTVRDDSQTTKTVQRAAIGTAIGAIIGAIAGGGKGAAIGAVVGAGGGAGSVYVQGRDDLELGRGTEITIRSGAPANTPR